jgi:cytoskeletal protein RodZ
VNEQAPPEQAQADYRALLIKARAVSRLTHEEISQATGLRSAYLKALEQGTLESMVSDPYVRNMLMRYGSYLGLDPDDLLRAYEASVGSSRLGTGDASGQSRGRSPGRGAAGQRNEPRRRAERKWRLRWLALGVFLAGTAIAVVVLDPLRLDLSARGETVSLAAGTTEIRPPVTTTTSTMVAAISVVAETQPTATSPKKHTVRIVTTGDVWLELTSESGGTLLFRGTRQSGEDLTVSVIGPLKSTVGRPELVRVFLNGVSTPVPGSCLWLITARGVRER